MTKSKVIPVTPDEAFMATRKAAVKLETASRGELQAAVLHLSELLVNATADNPDPDTRKLLESNFILHILLLHRGCKTLTEAVDPPSEAIN